MQRLIRTCYESHSALLRDNLLHTSKKQIGTGDAQMKTQIMYIENKSVGLSGPARIGRVSFSKTGKTLYYGGKKFQSLKGQGFKSNYFDVDSGDEFWISGCRKDGADRLYGERLPVEIDDDVREEYWTSIRGEPERREERLA